MRDDLDGDLQITPFPGYILGRLLTPSTTRTASGIILPGHVLRLPILKVIEVGPKPKTSPGDPEPYELHVLDEINANDLLVIRNADQMIDVGQGSLFIVRWTSAIGKVSILPHSLGDIT